MGEYEDITACRKIPSPQIVSQDHLGLRIIGIASVTEEFGDIFNVLAAAPEFILASLIIDSDQKGLLSRHGRE